ncbi:hypothetical protein MAR621_03996 [Maribacter dokdonensis]|uniref:hypothetical protein n=1 Tax=Maribacter dokdonensis TaxID=320912 RepID=UPI001B074582|nr:hypothetical protein [Maribacter dokdonensis]CAG2534345.1 hypothetical protein MAR621_03996 [Maribacter dokdonensis]
MIILKERIPGFSELAELVKDYSLKVLSKSYDDGFCLLGNNGGSFLSERESFFMFRMDELDNERIKIIKVDKEGESPYKLIIETNGDFESTYEIDLMLDDLETYLPPQMIEDLDNEFYKFA